MTDNLNYKYETLEIGEMDVHVRSLRNIQEFQDDQNLALELGIRDSQWSIFGILWPASYVLATIMENKEIEDLKILEVGCGLALASLVLKMRGADITATDYNPAVRSFLEENTRINQCDDIPFVRADWEDNHLESEERFDLIIGSDILYERDHSQGLSHFINKSAKDSCEVIIVGPNRGHQNHFTRAMEEQGFTYRRDTEKYFERDRTYFKGNVNHYHR